MKNSESIEKFRKVYVKVNKILHIILALFIIQSALAFITVTIGAGFRLDNPLDTSKIIESTPFQFYTHLFGASDTTYGKLYVGRGISKSCEVNESYDDTSDNQAQAIIVIKTYTSTIKVNEMTCMVDQKTKVGEEYDVYTDSFSDGVMPFTINYYINKAKSDPDNFIGEERAREYTIKILKPSLIALVAYFLVICVIQFIFQLIFRIKFKLSMTR
jgi:hypothetical protein